MLPILFLLLILAKTLVTYRFSVDAANAITRWINLCIAMLGLTVILEMIGLFAAAVFDSENQGWGGDRLQFDLSSTQGIIFTALFSVALFLTIRILRLSQNYWKAFHAPWVPANKPFLIQASLLVLTNVALASTTSTTMPIKNMAGASNTGTIDPLASMILGVNGFTLSFGFLFQLGVMIFLVILSCVIAYHFYWTRIKGKVL